MYCLSEKIVDACRLLPTLQAVQLRKPLTTAASGRGCPFNAGSGVDEIGAGSGRTPAAFTACPKNLSSWYWYQKRHFSAFRELHHVLSVCEAGMLLASREGGVRHPRWNASHIVKVQMALLGTHRAHPTCEGRLLSVTFVDFDFPVTAL